MSDTYNNDYKEKLFKFLEEIQPFVDSVLDKMGLNEVEVMVVPFPKRLCKSCAISVMKDMLDVSLNEKKYILISSDYQGIEQLFKVLDDRLILDEKYELVNPTRDIKESFEKDETHYIGHLKLGNSK